MIWAGLSSSGSARRRPSAEFGTPRRAELDPVAIEPESRRSSAKYSGSRSFNVHAGTAGFTSRQRTRVQFARHPGVELRRSFVDGRNEFHFPSRLRKARHRASALIVGVVIAAIAAAIVAIFVVRAVLNEAVPSVPLLDVLLGSGSRRRSATIGYDEGDVFQNRAWNPPNQTSIPPSLVGRVDARRQRLFGRITKRTTDYENHRTSPIRGSYVGLGLRAVTSYLALFYVALKASPSGAGSGRPAPTTTASATSQSSSRLFCLESRYRQPPGGTRAIRRHFNTSVPETKDAPLEDAPRDDRSSDDPHRLKQTERGAGKVSHPFGAQATSLGAPRRRRGAAPLLRSSPPRRLLRRRRLRGRARASPRRRDGDDDDVAETKEDPAERDRGRPSLQDARETFNSICLDDISGS